MHWTDNDGTPQNLYIYKLYNDFGTTASKVVAAALFYISKREQAGPGEQGGGGIYPRTLNLTEL